MEICSAQMGLAGAIVRTVAMTDNPPFVQVGLRAHRWGVVQFEYWGLTIES